MRTPTGATATAARLTAFVAVLLAAFGSAWAVGAAVEPSSTSSESESPAMAGHSEEPTTGHDDGGHEAAAADEELLPGLAGTVDGYTVEPVSGHPARR